jgi:hypothetical protein
MIYFGNKVGHFGSGGVYTCYLTKQAFHYIILKKFAQKYFYYTTMYLLWLLACSITYFYELDCVVFWYSQAN